MEVWYLQHFRWNAGRSGGRGYNRQSRGSRWRSIFHRGLHSGGGTSVFQHHPLKFQLAVTHLQDGFQQRTEVRGLTHRYCGVGFGRLHCCGSGCLCAIVWADAGVKRNGFDRVRAHRPRCSVDWIGKLLRIHLLGCSSPECRSWHDRGTRHLWEPPGGFRRTSVPAKVTICCRMWT